MYFLYFNKSINPYYVAQSDSLTLPVASMFGHKYFVSFAYNDSHT